MRQRERDREKEKEREGETGCFLPANTFRNFYFPRPTSTSLDRSIDRFKGCAYTIMEKRSRRISGGWNRDKTRDRWISRCRDDPTQRTSKETYYSRLVIRSAYRNVWSTRLADESILSINFLCLLSFLFFLFVFLPCACLEWERLWRNRVRERSHRRLPSPLVDANAVLSFVMMCVVNRNPCMRATRAVELARKGKY